MAETRKEKRQMRILRASKRYGHWRNWKASKLMRQQLEARLRATPRDSATDTGPETQFDYLDVELENEEQKPTCSFIYVDVCCFHSFISLLNQALKFQDCILFQILHRYRIIF